MHLYVLCTPLVTPTIFRQEVVVLSLMSTNAVYHAQSADQRAYGDISEELARFEAQFAPLFRRRDWQRRSMQYLYALLTPPAARRNAERLAAVVGANLRAFQRFLSEAPWEHRPIIDGLHAYLEPLLQSDDGIWMLEEIGFTKQGTKSVGVARQYNPTLGKRDNCQIGVFLRYASARGQAGVDTRLYLPQSWTNNRPRCQAAGVPDTVVYQSQADLALDMLRAAGERGHLHSRWVTGSRAFGRNSAFRDALDAGGWWYMLEVPLSLDVVVAPIACRESVRSARSQTVAQIGTRLDVPRVQMIRALAANLPPSAWHTDPRSLETQPALASTYAGVRICEWRDSRLDPARWLIVRRSADGADIVAYLSNAPVDQAPEVLGQVSDMHRTSQIDLFNQQTAIGLGEYETRSWRGWYHHTTLCLLAGALWMQLQQAVEEKATHVFSVQ